MKKIIIKIFSLVVLISMLTTSCELEEANVNPNAILETPAYTLLPFCQEYTARLIIGTPQVITGIFMQYYEGVNNHPLQVQQYVLEEGLYVDWDWNDFYNGPMNNLNQMIQFAEEDGEFYYAGIGKILMAINLGTVTSLWGDVPYSESFQGSENMSPKFDDQKSVYESIQTLLDDGISDLQQDYDGRKPGSEDLFFGGKTNQWIKMAHALKARYYMHLTKKTDALNYNPSEKALEAIANAMANSSNDLVYQYGFSSAEINPFYNFLKVGYIVPGESFNNLLTTTFDPRKSHLLKVKFGSATLSDAYFSSEASPVNLMTYYELKFLEAEARLRVNANDPEIQNALNEAISENMKIISADAISDAQIDSYTASRAQLTGNFEADLETIITQKYIALYTSVEPWTDYRRTGYPELTPYASGDNAQNPGGNIPRRFAYPETERLYNQNFPANLPTLQDRFWWDQE